MDNAKTISLQLRRGIKIFSMTQVHIKCETDLLIICSGHVESINFGVS